MPATLLGRLRAVLGALALALLVGIGLVPGVAAAAPEDPTDFQVTLAVRVCDDYDAIYANKARNNLQETFADLGPDSPYTPPATTFVEPSREQVAPQAPPACQPLQVPWTFTLGTGISGGTPADLSVVTGAFPVNGTATTTVAGVPELDRLGVPTGALVPSATTVRLNELQAGLAQSASTLWIQGGTPGARPTSQLNGLGDTYAFGALRCSYDALNGDNVEWIQYQGTDRHVFCYAYYVSPPPGSGTIVVEKELPAGTPDSTFDFVGNVSFEPGGTFDITTTGGSGSEAFVRAATASPAGEVWTVEEQPEPGYVLDDLTCTSRDGTSQTVVANALASITLGDRDLVTCTYVNRLLEPASLSLLKATVGGAGGPFALGVTGPSGFTADLTATTAAAGTPVPATGADLSDLEPGTYTVTETLPPASAAGTWSLTGVSCDGAAVPYDGTTGAFTVEVELEGASECTLTNTLTPPTPTPTTTPTATVAPTPSTSTGPDLPSTGGSGVVPLAASGAGLLAAGAALVLLSRRSRQH